MTLQTAPLEMRFWARVDRRRPNECWPWLGTLNPEGYGSIVDNGRLRRVTNVSLELAGCPKPPDKHHACHSCDNPACVNPAHLWWGTVSENMLDCVRKGRHPNALKTHCPRGHPLSGDNLYINPKKKTHRNCRECQRQSLRRRRAERKALRLQAKAREGETK
jgi:hypothetical protein